MADPEMDSATALIGFLEEVPLDEELCKKTLQIAIFAAKLDCI
jgi:hypothetical protein